MNPKSEEQKGQAKIERERRFTKTEVSVLDFYTDKVEKPTPIKTADSLGQKLDESVTDPNLQLRLYVVEDLSRDVIEVLGQKRRSILNLQRRRQPYVPTDELPTTRILLE